MRVCEVEGCGVKHYAKGLCKRHYQKVLDTGSVDGTPLVDLTGQQFGRLIAVRETDRTGRNGKDRRWICLCECGAETVVRHGHLTSGHSRSCGCLQRESRHKLRTETPGYGAMHGRVRSQRGSAETYRCVECAGPAKTWAYDHSDPNEIAHGVNAGAGVYVIYFSRDVGRYQPMCVPCHKVMDNQKKAERVQAEAQAEEQPETV